LLASVRQPMLREAHVRSDSGDIGFDLAGRQSRI
jgi:hypothetical protein